MASTGYISPVGVRGSDERWRRGGGEGEDRWRIGEEWGGGGGRRRSRAREK